MIKKINLIIEPYKHIIAVCILIMLCTLSILTYNFFEKQNQIIETGGFTDGKIKCVCNQEAYDLFMVNDSIINFSEVSIKDGQG